MQRPSEFFFRIFESTRQCERLRPLYVHLRHSMCPRTPGARIISIVQMSSKKTKMMHQEKVGVHTCSWEPLPPSPPIELVVVQTWSPSTLQYFPLHTPHRCRALEEGGSIQPLAVNMQGWDAQMFERNIDAWSSSLLHHGMTEVLLPQLFQRLPCPQKHFQFGIMQHDAGTTTKLP